MPSCVMRYCTNYTTKTSKSQGFTYHSFPGDSVIANRWIQIIRSNRKEDSWKPTKNTKICSTHFHDEDMYLTKKGTRRIRHGAVPEKCLFLSSSVSDNDNKETYEKPHELRVETNSTERYPDPHPSDDSMPAEDKRETKVFGPKCKTKALHNVEGMQKDETSKIIIANVYHYFEQEYEELTKTYEGVDLTPLSKFSERTALATGVSVSTVLEILQERARRNADVPQKPARKRPRQPESSSEEDSCGGDEDDGEHSTTEYVVDMLVVKEEPETYNDEPEVYVQLAGVKTEPDACGDDRELADPISVHVNTDPQSERDTTELADPISAHLNTEPQSEGDTTCSETVAAVQSAAKRHKGSIKQRHAEAPAASCGAPSGQLPLPPDQQLTLHNPLTNQQGFS